MKKIIFLVLFIFLAVNSYAKDDNLYELFKKDSEIKVYLEEVINETDNPEVKVDIFRKVFKETIEKRINLNFTYTENKSDADVIIIARIVKYIFTKKAFPLCLHTTTIMADIRDPKSSGKLIVDYEVIRPSDGESLLHCKDFMTEARKPIRYMEGENGFIYASERNVDKFIYKVFYKQKEKHNGSL